MNPTFALMHSSPLPCRPAFPWRLLPALLALFGFSERALATMPFQDPDIPLEARISDLLGRMTVEEKIASLGTRPDVPRLGVRGSPHIEGYHGVAQGGPGNWGGRNPTPTTQFPQAYGLGSTWDPDLIRRVAAAQAEEARYLYQHPGYNRAGLVVRAPNADLARDPRWGRTEEVYGEDPFHAGALATAFTQGLQGDHPRIWKTAALLKHFLANSHEDGRTHTSSDFDERLWREYYAKPFEMAITQGGARALMAAYNGVNGTPAHIHPMFREIVIGEWQVDGIICTDGGGLRLLVTDHKAFPDLASAAAACIKAGINQFLDRFLEPVTEAVERGLLVESDLDGALRGVFRTMFRLGLMDPPGTGPYDAIGRSNELEPWKRPDRHAFAREVTQKSIVLLKNTAGLLPLDRTRPQRLAIVGPHANHVLLDWYAGTPPYSVSPREGILDAIMQERAAPDPPVALARLSMNWVANMSDAAVELARSRDLAIVCMGNYPTSEAGWEIVTSPSEGKEAVDRKDIVLQADQIEFIRRVHAANPNTVVVLISSFPYALPWVNENIPAILHVTHCSQELGNALADVILGKVNPGGKLVQTWPRSVEELPPMLDYDLRKGRTYLYYTGEPQYPFGYGLSYTTFAFSNLQLSSERFASGDTVRVRLDLTNTGPREGDEVVQLYVRFLDSKVSRPLKQLRAFRRVTLAAGETQTVDLSFAADDLAYWDADHDRWTLEPGRIELLVGNSSADDALPLRAKATISP